MEQTTIAEAMVTLGLVTDKGEARRIVAQGAVYILPIDFVRPATVLPESQYVQSADWAIYPYGSPCLVRIGRSRTERSAVWSDPSVDGDANASTEAA